MEDDPCDQSALNSSYMDHKATCSYSPSLYLLFIIANLSSTKKLGTFTSAFIFSVYNRIYNRFQAWVFHTNNFLVLPILLLISFKTLQNGRSEGSKGFEGDRNGAIAWGRKATAQKKTICLACRRGQIQSLAYSGKSWLRMEEKFDSIFI